MSGSFLEVFDLGGEGFNELMLVIQVCRDLGEGINWAFGKVYVEVDGSFFLL